MPTLKKVIVTFGPLPCSQSTSSTDHSKQGIGYRCPCAILRWLVVYVYVCGMGVGLWIGVSRLCPPVRNDIVTPHYLLNSIRFSFSDANLELRRRKNLEQKLENSIGKRNRILDILLKQQNQQTLILNRQKEILQILSQRKKRWKKILIYSRVRMHVHELQPPQTTFPHSRLFIWTLFVHWFEINMISPTSLRYDVTVTFECSDVEDKMIGCRK